MDVSSDVMAYQSLIVSTIFLLVHLPFIVSSIFIEIHVDEINMTNETKRFLTVIRYSNDTYTP